MAAVLVTEHQCYRHHVALEVRENVVVVYEVLA
jgi:hypothetical protein